VIRILLVDDQALVRAGFRMILDAEPQMEVVGEASDGREAVDQVRELCPDVVLMDIRMPDLDGLEVSETTVKTHVARILMKLGLRDRVQAVVLASEAGIVQPGDNMVEAS
jgi:DNA-binding NarL/FixJ family response regulator